MPVIKARGIRTVPALARPSPSGRGAAGELDDQALVDLDGERDLGPVRDPGQHPRDLVLVTLQVRWRLRGHLECLSDGEEVLRRGARLDRGALAPTGAR